MSRIGRKPIPLPKGVSVKVEDGKVTVKGPKGELSMQLPEGISVEIDGELLRVKRATDSRRHKMFHGLARALINNMVIGVTQGYERKLLIVGRDYKVAKQGNKIVFNLLYTHPIVYTPPPGIEVEILPRKSTDVQEIVVKGIDKQLVGQEAARIRSFRPPEPYKGKGIRFADEVVRRKVSTKSRVK